MNNHHYGDTSNLNAPYDAIAVQGLGAVTYDGKTLPSIGYVWREASSDTLELQVRLNEELAKLDKCPLLLDGILGPRTCGAMHFMKQEGITPIMFVEACENPPETLIMPKVCAGGVVAPITTVTTTEEVDTKKKAAALPIWVWGLGLGVLAVGAAMIFKKKR